MKMALNSFFFLWGGGGGGGGGVLEEVETLREARPLLNQGQSKIIICSFTIP